MVGRVALIGLFASGCYVSGGAYVRQPTVRANVYAPSPAYIAPAPRPGYTSVQPAYVAPAQAQYGQPTYVAPAGQVQYGQPGYVAPAGQVQYQAGGGYVAPPQPYPNGYRPAPGACQCQVGAAEICGNGCDDNCNGVVDEGCR